MPTRLSNAEISAETDALMRIVRYNIRRYMRLQDINQKEIAELLNLTRPAISQMLAGTSRPRFDQVFMIAQYLGVNMNDLMDETAYQPGRGTTRTHDGEYEKGPGRSRSL